MMNKPSLISLYFIFCLASCKQRNCTITDYHSIDWQTIDSTTSFYICPNTAPPLAATDFVEIEYSGTLQTGDNLIVKKEADTGVLSLLTNAKFGSFRFNDTTLPKYLRHVIGLLTKKSAATIRIKFGNIAPIEFDKKITVYFKDNIDSSAAAKWINEIKQKPFVDSTYYISKETALKNWNKEAGDDWQSILEVNPLPTSVEIFIKPSFFEKGFIKNLKEDLMKSTSVSQVVYANILGEGDLTEFNRLLSQTYLLRVKPKE